MAGSNLMSCYVDPVRELLERGNGGKIVIGTIDYKIIQGNEEIKDVYETIIRTHSGFFIRFHPELPRNNKKNKYASRQKIRKEECRRH